jgi:hypothetical protein
VRGFLFVCFSGRGLNSFDLILSYLVQFAELMYLFSLRIPKG